jgi:hypothetical protein
MWSIFCIISLVVSEYIYTTRKIDANVTLKEKIRATLLTASLYSYSTVSLFVIDCQPWKGTTNSSKIFRH